MGKLFFQAFLIRFLPSAMTLAASPSISAVGTGLEVCVLFIEQVALRAFSLSLVCSRRGKAVL